MPRVLVLKRCPTPTAPARPSQGLARRSSRKRAGRERHDCVCAHLRNKRAVVWTNLIRSHTARYKDSRVSVCLGTDTSSGCPYSTAPGEGLDGRDFLSLK